ncbi:MAG: peptidoglycan binding domain-containing protein [Actinobacteria bacterium]|nr:peptidoglycan binding domain-containing protein [Actinomycetota bacterium]
MSLKNPRDRVNSRTDYDVRNVFGSFSDSRPKGRKGGRRRRGIIGVVLVVCAVVAVLVAADYWANAGRIFQGVTVGNVSVGGETSEEARGMVEERAADELGEIRFTGGPEEFALSARDINLNVDAAGTVERAYAVGREGSIPKRIGERTEAAWGTVETSPVVDYDRETVRSRIENRAARANAQPRDATVNVRGSEAEVVESREGYTLDVADTAANLDDALASMSGEVRVAGEAVEPAVLTPAAEEAAGIAEEAMSAPVTLTADGEEWEFSREEIGQSLSFTPRGNGELRVGLDREQLRESLSDVYDDLTVEPVEAGFEIRGDKVAVTKSRTGTDIEEEELLDALEAGLFDGKREYEVPVVTTEPELTTAQAEKLKPTELIGTYRTDYTLSSDKSPERVDNLDIASKAISGKFLAPGEVFSVNEILSPLEYNETKVIIEGKEEKADGGGLCQVSSTLYNAVNYAGLDVVERHPHDAQLPYIRPGLDATVWFGSLDMKFENTTDGYIFLREYVADDGYIYAEVWGKPTGKKVEMDSEPLYLGADYSQWETYQKVTDEDGKVIFDEVLHKDTYMPLIDEKGKTIAPNNSEELNIAPVNY